MYPTSKHASYLLNALLPINRSGGYVSNSKLELSKLDAESIPGQHLIKDLNKILSLKNKKIYFVASSIGKWNNYDIWFVENLS